MSMNGRLGVQIAGALRLLNGVNNLEIALGNVTGGKIQAALVTANAAQSNYYLWWRVEYASGLAATTIPTADGFVIHGGTEVMEDVDPTKLAYLYVLLTTSAGVAQVGGVLDYVLITRDMG